MAIGSRAISIAIERQAAFSAAFDARYAFQAPVELSAMLPIWLVIAVLFARAATIPAPIPRARHVGATQLAARTASRASASEHEANPSGPVMDALAMNKSIGSASNRMRESTRSRWLRR